VRLPQLLAAAVERYPLLEIELHHEVSGAAFEKVRDGTLDAAFYYGNLTHPAVASRALRELEFRVAAPAAWRDRLQGASFAALAGEPWILAPSISTYRVLSDDLFNKHGITPSTVIEADNEAVIRSLVAAGLGIALMRDDLARTLVDVNEACLWDGAQLSTTLQFLWRTEQARDSVTLALLDLIGDVWLPQPV
jgi:DNA-binding transcriptional LysR family regulator